MRSAWRWTRTLGLVVAWLCAARVSALEPVAGVATSPADQRVLDAARALGLVFSRREPGGALDEAGLLARTQDWPEATVLVVDAASASLRVLRRADRTILVRTFEPGAIESSPYAAALAASELLGLARQTPPARVELAQAKPAQSVGNAASPSPDPGLWCFGAGGALATTPGRDPTLLRPLLSAGYELATGRGPMFWTLALAAAPFGRFTRAVLGPVEQGEVRYTRSDLGLRLGAGRRVLAGSVLGYLTGGAALVSARAEVDGDGTFGARRSGRAWAGVGGAFRYEPWQRFAVMFGIEGAFVPKPFHYLVRGQTVVREGTFRLESSLSLAWLLR